MSSAISDKAPADQAPSSLEMAPEIIIREPHFWEGFRMGKVAARTFHDTDLTKFLYPFRLQHPRQFARNWKFRSQQRLLDPRSFNLVACKANNPAHIVGYATCFRLGNDEAAKRYIASRDSLWMFLLNWMFWVYCKAWKFLIGDKAIDLKAMALFESFKQDDEHWTSHPERHNRWHAQSFVILKEYQRKGIGRRMMLQVIEKAENDGVPIGLEASAQGVLLYRSLGFELLGRFHPDSQKIESGGGIMMWTPSCWETKETA